MLAFKKYFGGAVAQLGARLDGIEEVVGSNPISSTKILYARERVGEDREGRGFEAHQLNQKHILYSQVPTLGLFVCAEPRLRASWKERLLDIQ